MFWILIVEYSSFLWNNHYIKWNILNLYEGHIVEFTSPEITIHTSLSTLC